MVACWEGALLGLVGSDWEPRAESFTASSNPMLSTKLHRPRAEHNHHRASIQTFSEGGRRRYNLVRL